jgi:tetratricopeptide (TPR) repeat protein
MDASDEKLKTFKEVLIKIIGVSSLKDGIIERFLANRCNHAIPDEERDTIFWKLLCYEIMYLWNLLGSCSTSTIEVIIDDCKIAGDSSEPILGLSQFLMGACYAMQRDYENAITSYEKCIEICNENPSNLHLFYIPAYASYELAVLKQSLSDNSESSQAETQKLLQNAQTYRNFDFEHRLKLRIHNFKVC